jgi:hypothetical protein
VDGGAAAAGTNLAITMRPVIRGEAAARDGRRPAILKHTALVTLLRRDMLGRLPGRSLPIDARKSCGPSDRERRQLRINLSRRPTELLMREWVLAGTTYLLFSVVQYWTAEKSGNFWWFDSASHALNGVFIHDFVTSGAFGTPVEYTLSYFSKYPGLTIGFYPPGFASLLALCYGVVGVGHPGAQLCMSAATLALATGVFGIAKEAGLRWPLALSSGLLAVAFPEMLLWGRQIQPEIPAYAFAVWSAFYFLRWLVSLRSRQLFLAAVLFVGGLYVKQTVAFLAPVYLLVMVSELGWTALRRRDVWIATAIGAILALPLLALTVAAGAFNLTQATTGPGGSSPWDAATYYLAALPNQLGWLPLTLTIVGLFGMATRAVSVPRPAARLLVGWVSIGLAFFTVISLKSPRFSTAVLPALAILSVLPFDCYLRNRRLADLAALGAALGITMFGFVMTPARSFLGPRAAAEYIAAVAPPDSNVLLLAHRSANFIYDLRAYTTRSDIRIVRAEKLYTKYRVSRDFGSPQDTGADQPEMLNEMRAHNIAFVVLERDFWDDIPSIHRLHTLVMHWPFEFVRSITLTDTEDPARNGNFDIYRRTHYQYQKEPETTVDLPLVGRHYTIRTGAM